MLKSKGSAKVCFALGSTFRGSLSVSAQGDPAMQVE
jgi:hypothetical protein